jgi:hypothetical protein
MAVTRPLKEGSVTTYQQKVAAGFPDILASEADADLDTIYAAWNGGVGTANLIDGCVTSAKIQADQITTRELANASVNGSALPTLGQHELVQHSIQGNLDIADGSVVRQTISAGHSLWTSGNATGPGSGTTLTAADQHLVGISISMIAARPVQVFGVVHVNVSRTAAGGSVGTCTITYRIGGTATGIDGTLLQSIPCDMNIANGSTVGIRVPVVGLYTPGADGAQFVKLAARSSDVTNYYMSATASASSLTIVEFS